MKSLWTMAAIALLTSAASACPICDTGTGEQVRTGIFDHGFGYHVLVTLLPFVVLIAIVAMIHFGFPFPRRRRM